MGSHQQEVTIWQPRRRRKRPPRRRPPRRSSWLREPAPTDGAGMQEGPASCRPCAFSGPPCIVEAMPRITLNGQGIRLRRRRHDPRRGARERRRDPHALLVSQALHRRQLPDLPGVRGGRSQSSCPPAARRPPTAWWCTRTRGRGRRIAAASCSSCSSAIPGSTSRNGGREHPRNEFERYVVRVRGAVPPAQRARAPREATPAPAT